MARWLTFDRKTASALRKQLPKEQVFEHGAHNAVEYVSGSTQDMVTLLPTGSTGEVAIAVFRRPVTKTGTSTVASPEAKPSLVEKIPAKVSATPPVFPQADAPSGPSAWKVVEPGKPAPLGTPAAKIEPGLEPSRQAQRLPQRSTELKMPFERQKPPAIRAGGILGTRDELVFDDEPVVKPKRNWWQRFWDDDDE